VIAMSSEICFEICSGPGDGEVTCAAPGIVTIGTDDTCDIVLDGDLVAPERASLHCSLGPGGLTISSDINIEYDSVPATSWEDIELPAVLRVSVTELWVTAALDDGGQPDVDTGASPSVSQDTGGEQGVVCQGCGRVNAPGAAWCDRCGRDLG